MSTIIGLLMLIAIFAAISVMISEIMTWKDALMIFGISIIGTTWIMVAVYLMTR